MLDLTIRNNNNQDNIFIPYTPSEIEALVAGYVEKYDERAYNKRYFIKNNKKWIHNLEALRNKLNNDYGRYIDDEELSAKYPEGFGYDVENYYARNQSHKLKNSKSFKDLMSKVKIH